MSGGTAGTAASIHGRVGYLALGGRLVPAFIVGDAAKKKVETVDVSGVSRLVVPERMYWLGDKRLGSPAGLGDYWQAVLKRAGDCDLEMAWELLQESDVLDDSDARELAELTPGGSNPEDVDGLILAIFEESVHFKIKRGRVHPSSPQALQAAVRKKGEEARARLALERATATLAARLGGLAEPEASSEDEAREISEAVREHLAAVEDQAVHGRDSTRADLAGRLMAALPIDQKGEPGRRAFDLLVRLGLFEPDENLFVRRAGIRSRFPQRVEEEAATLAGTSWSSEGRQDLRHLYTVAIDDEATTEVDDAFALAGDRLYVFIADAGALVPPGSEVEAEAARRASTLYVPEGKIPMLPPLLGEQAASLEAEVDRPALCFAGELDPSGRLSSLEIVATLCRVDRRLTYVETDALLAGQGPEYEEARRAVGPEAEALVQGAAGMMVRHQANRARLGALMLQRSEVSIQIDDEGRVEIHAMDANGPARQLVSEMMVAVGVATANWCGDHQVPCIYRTQPRPDKLPESLGRSISDPIEQIAILRTLKPTTLSTRPGPHFTLGVEAYTQVTSPIRRYQDLVMHHQIKGFLATGRAPFGDGELMEVFDAVDKEAGARRRVETASRRYWTLRFLEQNPDRVWDALVTRELHRRWLVELPELVLQTPYVARGRLHVGDRLQLRVADVDARGDRLVLVEA